MRKRMRMALKVATLVLAGIISFRAGPSYEAGQRQEPEGRVEAAGRGITVYVETERVAARSVWANMPRGPHRASRPLRWSWAAQKLE